VTPRFKLTLPFEAASILLDEASDYLFIGSANGNLGIWDTSTGEFLAAPALHTREVTTISRYGDFLVTGGADGVVALWSLRGLFDSSLSGAPATPLASVARHGLPLVSVAFDPFCTRQRPIFHSIGKDRSFRTWNLEETEQGLSLRMLQEVTLPEVPVGFAVAPDGARVYVADAKGVRTFLCSRSGPLETVCEAGSVGPVGGASKGSAGELQFTAIACSYASRNVFVGTSAGSILALLPGGGTQMVRTRSEKPVTQLAQMDDYFESKEQCPFPTTLKKSLDAFSLSAPTLSVSLPLQYCSVGRPSLLSDKVLSEEVGEMVSGRELDSLAEIAQAGGLLATHGAGGQDAKQDISRDPYSIEQKRLAAERASFGSAGPGADIYRVGTVKFSGDVYDEINEM